MERNSFQSVIIAVMAGIFLIAGNPAYAAEQPPVKKETPPAAVKSDKKEPAATKSVIKKPAAAKAVNKEKETDSEGVSIHLKFPFFSPLFTDVPLASVNDEKIMVHDLQNALMAVHEKMTVAKETPAKQAFLDTLQRLINAKLVVLEAKNIELDQLPEIKDDFDKNAEMQLRQVLFQERVKDLKPDVKEVDKIYRDMIKEWKLKSVLFLKENDAKKFQEDIKAGQSFDELREKAIKEGKVEQAGQNEDRYANKASLGPVLGEAVSDLKAGVLSPIINVTNAFVIVKVEDVRSVENPELKEKARNEVLSRMKLESLKAYKDELYKKYTRENTKLLKSIDFESAKPGLAKLLKDKRVLVTIKGEKPVTVGELAEAVRDKFFHGVELAIKEKKVNREKLPILDEVVSKRVFRRAALDKSLDKSQEYKNKLDEHKDSILFGTFIEKVVKPDVKITGQELKDYYKNHVSQYLFPQMLQIEEIVFKSRDNAQTGIDKLRKGMDFKWLKNNADGQVDKNSRGLLHFEGQLMTVKSFPESLQKVLNGAKTGDYRLYESPEGYSYVLFVEKDVPSRTQPFEEVKDDVAQKVTWQNFSKALDEWFKKLREAYPVKIYLQEQ
jgi:hypothetical protein